MRELAVSVVVPTVDRVALLERCLRGLAAQAGGPAYEVLVVHDGDPGIVALLDAWQDRLPLRPLRCPDRGASAKRNLGWRSALAPVVAFTDDDCEPQPGWLAAGVAAMVAGVDLVQGQVEPHPEDAQVDAVFARTIEVREPNPHFANANLLYRRTALEIAGGYDERLSAGEDTDLAWRVKEAGGAVGWAPQARVWHAVRAPSFLAHLRSLPRWASLPAVVRRHPGLRDTVSYRFFWKPVHPRAVVALAGLLLAPGDRRSLLLTLPLLVFRVRRAGVRGGLQLAASDLAEVAVVVVGSVRHRSLLL